MTQNKITSIAFLVFPGFPMACLTSMIEPLRAANEIAGTDAFAWTILSEDGAPVTSSAQVVFQADAGLQDCCVPDHIYLLSSPVSAFADPARSYAKLRWLARHGAVLGAVSGGVFPLARAGILDCARVSVHWCYAAAFEQEFPKITATSEVIAIDGRHVTVSGAAAAFDLALHLVSDHLGQGVSTEVACWFQHAIVRGQGVDQKVPTVEAESTDDMLPCPVRAAFEIFAGRIGQPVRVADVANEIGISARQLERMFRKATGRSPLQYYRAMRMNAARQLVLYSNDTMTSIALAVGYASATPMIQNYQDSFGIHPHADRDKINVFRVCQNASVPVVR
ncbi:MAG: GlxA family transcriptional regulator [Roseobacter sp.]